MRKIKKKAKGPSLRESWWLIPAGVVALALIGWLVSRTVLAPQPDRAPAGWVTVIGVASMPILDALPPPQAILQPADFVSAFGSEGESFRSAGGRWITVYELTQPPGRAEVVFFLKANSAAQLLAAMPGRTVLPTPVEGPLGDEAFTVQERVLFRRGSVLVRVHPTAGAGEPAIAAARAVDRALIRRFGAEP